MKTYNVNLYGKPYTVYLVKSTYHYGNRLAVCLYTTDDEPFATLTVNLPEEELTSKDCAFIDTNNCEWLPEFLVENDIAFPTWNFARSGFCVYPEYLFNLEKLEGGAR